MSKILLDKLSHPQRVRFLYKSIFRLHRGLPQELRVIGDNYVRDEFRLHMKCNPTEAQLFITEWARYAASLTKQLGLHGKSNGEFGEHLDVNAINKMKNEQVVQLYELMLASKGLKADVNAANIRQK